jgi:beta-mannosidase
MMNEIGQTALSLLAPSPANVRELGGEWRVALAEPGQSDAIAYAAPDYSDVFWKKAYLPHLRYATTERDTVWYRHHFWLDAPLSSHTILRFGGAFYETHVWLNGHALGSHQGYFQPFGFDVSDVLQAGENVIAVQCHFPIEANALKRKTVVAGIFADWDCKPYPSAYYPNLPAPHEWRAPLGLWQPVHLQTCGAVLIESYNLFPELTGPHWETQSADSANIHVDLQVRNLTPLPQKVTLHLTIAPHNFDGETTAVRDWEINLDSLTHHRIGFDLTLSEPRLWFPWTHGTPHLYRATLWLDCGNDAPQELTQTFGVRSIEAEIDDQNWNWRLNGRRIFPRGSSYISEFYLDRANLKDMSRDLLLMREANLDLLRVHAHIGPVELYRLCDEQGMLVMCDFPLIWAYAYNLPPEDQDGFQANVQRQTGEMVGLLGSHPSIGLWAMHNEPPWSPDTIFVGSDMYIAQTNRQMNEAMAEQVRALDPTRPALAASGQYDRHLYSGWYTGHWRDNRDLRPAFPSEFGVQALPNLDSPFWETVNTAWPVSSDDPTWAYAGYQPMFWDHPGVGAPAQYATLSEYIQEGQEYQAFYTRYVIDQLRRKKFQPVNGYIHFVFNDCFPAITWATLDYYRHPKAGYHALAEVSRPTHVCIDFGDEAAIEAVFHLVYSKGMHFKADLYVVNDDYRLKGRAQLRWWLSPRSAGPFYNGLRRWLAPGMTILLPRADESALLVKTVEIPLTRSGEYTFHTQLTLAGRLLDENHYDLRVGAAPAHTMGTHRVPGFLISRIYEFGSLHATADGFMLRLHNSTMPALMQHLTELCVDGQLLDSSQVEVIHNGQARSASSITPETPLEFSTGEHLTLVVHTIRLSPGRHELKFVGQLFGIGEIEAHWSDQLT